MKNHRNLTDRQDAAQACARKIHFSIPVLIDDLENSVTCAYAAHPNRLFILDAQGIIAFHGKPGPFGTDLNAFEAAIVKLRQKIKD